MNLWGMIKEVMSEWKDDNVTRLAAALSYYTVISLAPLLVFTITIASQFYARSAVQDELIAQIEGLVGSTGGEAITSILENASQPEAGGAVATIVSLGVLLFGASNVFSQLQSSLDAIWDVQPKPNRGIWNTIKDRSLSFAMVLGIGFLLLVSLILNTAISAATQFLGDVLPLGPWFWQVVNFLVSFAVITALFALMFKFLPDVEIRWRDVWVGAIITSLLFNIGKFLIGLYLGSSSVASAYGAAGSIIVILIWVYYSAIILFLGAEITQVYARQRGTRIVPASNAMFVSERQQVAQGARGGGAFKARPQILDEPNPGYASPLAYPASEAVRVRQQSPAMIPVTGLQRPEALKVVPVLVLGTVAAGYGLVETGRAAISRIRNRSGRDSRRRPARRSTRSSRRSGN
ncbi:MAG TPA: YihY/virulence factor BrkB family protein [Anaerolineaceae bacterium]|nr:YihY/virulence factor BrkB family protein [Anaerolineaceae bacterium]